MYWICDTIYRHLISRPALLNVLKIKCGEILRWTLMSVWSSRNIVDTKTFHSFLKTLPSATDIQIAFTICITTEKLVITEFEFHDVGFWTAEFYWQQSYRLIWMHKFTKKGWIVTGKTRTASWKLWKLLTYLLFHKCHFLKSHKNKTCIVLKVYISGTSSQQWLIRI